MGSEMCIRDSFAVCGLELDNYATTLPAEKGLSSSAALCVLVARAFSEAYGLRLSVRGEMELAYLGETTTPSQCGRMDQCCAFGVQPVRARHARAPLGCAAPLCHPFGAPPMPRCRC